MNNELGRRGGCTAPLSLIFLLVCFVLSLVAAVRAAEIMVVPKDKKFLDRVLDGPVDKFGTYGDAYYKRRWERMCRTGARYEAMREANDLGKGFPC